MSSLVPDQVAHIREHQAAFDAMRMEQLADVTVCFEECGYVEDLYLGVCSDLGISPRPELVGPSLFWSPSPCGVGVGLLPALMTAVEPPGSTIMV